MTEPSQPRFSEELIRAKAHLLYVQGREKGQFASSEEYWQAAINELEEEYEQIIQKSETRFRFLFKNTLFNFLKFFPRSIKEQSIWSWITSIVIPVLAVTIVFIEIDANRKITQSQLKETFRVQKEFNRQQELQNYIRQMSDLIISNDLTEKYQKDSEGNYSSSEPRHPDAIIATALTKSVLRVLSPLQENPIGFIDNEKGAILVFLKESGLIDKHRQVIYLDNADFRYAALSKTDLEGAGLKGINLSFANLSFANLSKTDLRNANLSPTRPFDFNFNQPTQNNIPKFDDIIDTSLSHANLVGADLRNANLENAILRSANLVEANLSEANLSGTDLIGTLFVKANLSNSKLDRAHIIGAIFSEANITAASYQGSFLIGGFPYDWGIVTTTFRKANLTDADFSNAKIKREYLVDSRLCRTILPENFKLSSDRDCKELGINSGK